MNLRINVTASLFIFLIVFVFSGLNGKIKAQEVSETLPEFSGVKIYNGIEVVIIPSEENRIIITGHSKEEVKFKVVENQLEIRLSLENIWSKDNTLIKVFTNDVHIIDANQGSSVEVSGELRGNNMVFKAQEGSHIRAEIKAEQVNIKAVTAGQIELTGIARNQEVHLNTGGQFFGRYLETNQTEIYTGTGGKADIFSTDYCKATAKFGGTIRIYGNPEVLDHKTSLGGKILEMN